ncbi:MAG: gliding motility protein GldN [Chitinophagaceae bacterium]|nr:gliding motility protein GldN [Chitinophagaceae bacterium]
MKNLIIKACMCSAFILLMVQSADAQRTGRRRANNNTGQQPTDTSGQGNQQNNINTPPSSYNPYANIPIRVDSSGVNDGVVKKSLRQDNAFDKSGLTQRTPLPYEHLRWDDALYAEKVWRELDLREKVNKVFQYDATDDNGSQMFIDMLLKAVNSGEVTAFADDRFTTPMTVQEIQQLTQGSADTNEVRDVNNPNIIKEYIVTRKTFNPREVMRIRIKEEWVFDRESSRMFCRILGICPIKSVIDERTKKERGISAMFWIYYPDLRPILARYEVYNSKNMGQSRMTWEELFESRMFSSYILKSSIENPGNKYIRSYIKDPILALLEGDNIKEKIFNFEQDLWSY